MMKRPSETYGRLVEERIAAGKNHGEICRDDAVIGQLMNDLGVSPEDKELALKLLRIDEFGYRSLLVMLAEELQKAEPGPAAIDVLEEYLKPISGTSSIPAKLAQKRFLNVWLGLGRSGLKLPDLAGERGIGPVTNDGGENLAIFTSLEAFKAFADGHADGANLIPLSIDCRRLLEIIDGIAEATRPKRVIFDPVVLYAERWASDVKPVPLQRFRDILAEAHTRFEALVEQTLMRFATRPFDPEAFEAIMRDTYSEIQSLADEVVSKLS